MRPPFQFIIRKLLYASFYSAYFVQIFSTHNFYKSNQNLQHVFKVLHFVHPLYLIIKKFCLQSIKKARYDFTFGVKMLYNIYV